jgi:hypothetical protein
MNFKRLLFLWLITVLFPGGNFAQVYIDHISRSFGVTARSSVEVYNKYGKVHVITWDKDSVNFEVDFRITTSSPEKLKKLKDAITFDFTNTNYYVIAKTTFTKSGGIFSDVVETIIPSNGVSINYTVRIPKDLTLKIENKFGDVYIDDFAGNLGLVLSNGNLKANYLKGNTTIKLSSGDGAVNRIDKGQISISYGDFDIKNAGRSEFDTRNSRIYIENAENLRINSRGDKYSIDQISRVSGSGNFSTVKISKLLKEFNMEMKYGGLTLDNIPVSFSLININSSYTDIDLTFLAGAAYNLDVTHYADVYFTYPSQIAKIETQDFNKEQKLKLTFGQIGSNVTPSSPKVKIVAEKKCYINILHK